MKLFCRDFSNRLPSSFIRRVYKNACENVYRQCRVNLLGEEKLSFYIIGHIKKRFNDFIGLSVEMELNLWVKSTHL